MPIGSGGAAIIPQILRDGMEWNLADQTADVRDALFGCIEKLFATAIDIDGNTALNIVAAVTGEVVLQDMQENLSAEFLQTGTKVCRIRDS